MSYTWQATGAQAITVTAANAVSTATDVYPIFVTAHSAYLPLIMHSAARPTSMGYLR